MQNSSIEYQDLQNQYLKNRIKELNDEISVQKAGMSRLENEIDFLNTGLNALFGHLLKTHFDGIEQLDKLIQASNSLELLELWGDYIESQNELKTN